MDILYVLAEITVYSGIIFAMTMLLKKCFGSKMSAFLHYAVWMVLIVRLLTPVTITSPVHFFTLPEEPSVVNETEQEVLQPYQPIERSAAYTADFDSAPAQAPSISAQPQNKIENSTPVKKHIKITWQQIAVIVWFAGTGILIIYLAAVFLTLRRHLKRNGVPPSAKLRRLFEETKAQMGIQANIRLICTYEYGTPALMLPRTVIMPIDALAAMDDEQTTYALRHELMHYKRGDHVMSILLSLLNAVYWFNPFVWLAFRQMRMDMETACDGAVVKRLDDSGRGRYASLIVRLFAQPEHRQVVLGMAQANARKAAEQRVRGIFMKDKSKRSAKLISAALTAVLLVTCFTTACQPTPEKPIVQTKNNDTVADAVAQYQAQDEETVVIHTYTAPETWQAEAHDEVKNIDIFVDAKVDVPTDTWGLYELVPITPTEDDVRKMLTAIVGDATIYGEHTLESKEYLLEQITRLEWQKKEFERRLNEGEFSEDEKLAQDAEENGPEPAPHRIKLTEEDLQRNIESYTAMINEAKAKLPNAPDEETIVKNEFVLADMFRDGISVEEAQSSGITLFDDGMNRVVGLRGTVDLGRDTPADISMEYHCRQGTHFNLRFTDYDDNEQGFFGPVAYTGQELFKCDISAEQAAETARAKVAEMGFDYLDIDTTQVCAMLDRKRKEGDQFPECFEFVFTRVMDGATATFAHGDGVMTEDEVLALEYAPHWKVDEVTVHVDDSGIISVDIGTLKSDVARQAYGIELMDFKKIMGIFETQVFIENAFRHDAYMEKAINREIHIDSIRLGYMPTAWKDHSGKLIYTPVWDFFGYEVVTYEEGTGKNGDFAEFLDENNQRTNDLVNQSLLTINALDGTIMIRE